MRTVRPRRTRAGGRRNVARTSRSRRRLARAVDADDADPVPGREPPGDVAGAARAALRPGPRSDDVLTSSRSMTSLPSRAVANRTSASRSRGGGSSAMSALAASIRNRGLLVRAGGPRRSQASSLRSRFARRSWRAPRPAPARPGRARTPRSRRRRRRPPRRAPPRCASQTASRNHRSWVTTTSAPRAAASGPAGGRPARRPPRRRGGWSARRAAARRRDAPAGRRARPGGAPRRTAGRAARRDRRRRRRRARRAARRARPGRRASAAQSWSGPAHEGRPRRAARSPPGRARRSGRAARR